MAHVERAAVEDLVVRPERAPQKPHSVNLDFCILQQVNAQLCGERGCTRGFVIDLERLPVSVPFMVARNIDYRATLCSFGKLAYTVAQWVMNITGSDEHIEVWLRVRQIPATLLNMKVRKNPNAHRSVLGP